MKLLKPARKTVLPNGLTIVSLTNPHSFMHNLTVSVGIGSAHDGLKKGLSHFLEHMIFTGTARHSAFDIKRFFLGRGGNLEASTTYKETNYNFGLPVSLNEFAEMAALVKEVLLNSIFPERNLEHECETILNEVGERRDKSGISRFFYNKLMEGTYTLPDPGGYMAFVERARRQDFVDHISEKYSPDNTVLYVSGPMSHEDVVDILGEIFGDWKPTGYKPEKPERVIFKPVDYRVEDAFRIQNQMTVFFQDTVEGAPLTWLLNDFADPQIGRALLNYRYSVSSAYGVEPSTQAYDNDILRSINTYSRPHTSGPYLLALVNWLQKDLTDNFAKESFESDLSYVRTKILPEEAEHNANGLHSRMIDLHKFHGRLLDMEEYYRLATGITFDDVVVRAKAHYQKPVAMVVHGPDPYAVPSLEELSDYTPKPLYGVRRSHVNAAKMKPDLS